MLSRSKKFLFIHIPKTAGNSIQNVLKEYSEDEILVENDLQDGVERFAVVNKELNSWKHSHVRFYKQKLPQDVYEQLYVFACVRNPWDRMVSFYFSPHRKPGPWNRDEFVRLVKGMPTMASYMDTRPRVFARYLDRWPKIEVDYVMRFENLQEDFDHVCEAIGIPRAQLPRRNVTQLKASQRKHYSEYYDEGLIDLVAKRFRFEVDHFGYSFEASAEQVPATIPAL